MTNLDGKTKQKADIISDLTDAINKNDTENIRASIDALGAFISEELKAEYNGVVAASDRAILASRGNRVLTSKETAFWENVINVGKNYQNAVTKLPDAIEPTFIDAVMDDIKSNFPLINAVYSMNTSTLTKIVINKQGIQQAAWGQINSAIVQELSGAIDTISADMYKLSAWMSIPADMLDLGPSWVERYCRTLLTESLAYGLEKGIVDGTGKDQLIGMMRDIDNASAGTYQEKTTVKLDAITPVTIGAIIKDLAKTPAGRQRPVTDVVFIVNPVDYFSKVFPATTIMAPDGTYWNNVMPYPMQVIQSIAVPENKAVIGLAKKYFLGVGTAKTGSITYSDEYKFLEDVRTFKIKTHIAGTPLDNNAFTVCDITDLESAIWAAKTVSTK